MKKARDPFELKLSDEQKGFLSHWLRDELQKGLDAKAIQDQEVDYWWMLYEQARTRTGRNQPWPDAADLTSFLASEKVDALHARIIKTIWTEPVWTVEGWGEAADRAPFVEEFTQWKAEEGRLQNVFDKLVLLSLVEPRGLLEVYEGTELRTSRKEIAAKLQADPQTGGMVYDETGKPQLETGPDGKYVEAKADELAANTVIDSTERVRTGPAERVIPYRDSVILPGHARDKEDIWGYGKRLFRKLSDLQRKAKAGFYDEAAVSRITAGTDKEPDSALQRANMDVAPESDSPTSEKELWELLVLVDLNALFTSSNLPKVRGQEDTGARWYLTTLHLPTAQLLRIQHDDLERSRFVPVILFPRPDRVTEGFSFVGHKLVTTIEEHTAWRNMAADRASMVVQAPIKRLTGALWDPLEQPWGPKAVIDVRDMREIEPVTVPDVTAPVLNHIEMCERTADRLSGINDIASGQVSSESRTLGEINMATEQSFVRMDLIVRRFQEALEDIAQIRHAIWKRTLAEQPDGVAAPQSLVTSLEGRGVSIDEYLPGGKFTAALLDGAFRFKPHGSVETADPNRLRQDWVQAMQALPMLMQAFPSLAIQFQNPAAARAMMQQWCRVFRVSNPQAFLGAPGQPPPMMPPPQGLMGMLQGGMPPPGMPPHPPPMMPPGQPMAPGPQGPQ